MSALLRVTSIQMSGKKCTLQFFMHTHSFLSVSIFVNVDYLMITCIYICLYVEHSKLLMVLTVQT